MSKVVYSLFDGSGIAVLDWAKAGHTCYCFNADEGDHGEYSIKMEHPNIHYIDLWIDGNFVENVQALGLPKPNIIFAFPSCTFMAQSGEQHERTEDELEDAVQSAKQVEEFANYWSCPWYVENPVGKLSTKWRKPNYYFHPCEYGAYLSEDEGSFHPKMPLRDAYNKKTCIWCSDDFVMPFKKPVESIGFCWSWKYLGGKSKRTKILRSLTPRGWARAVFEFNQGV